MADSSNIHFIDYNQSAMDVIAEHIVSNTTPPNLTHCQIIMQDQGNAGILRQSLLKQAGQSGYPALLGPHFFSLDHWLPTYLPADVNICSEQVRLLILVEALNNSPNLLKQANAWSLADDLLKLFDELTLNKISLAQDANAFHQQLAKWYQTDSHFFSGMQQEAGLIHQLWHAWHEQLQAQGYIDKTAATVLALQNSLDNIAYNTQLHFIGIVPQYKAQIDWLNKILQLPNVNLWLQGSPSTRAGKCRGDEHLYQLRKILNLTEQNKTQQDDYSQTLSRIFDYEPQFKQRALQQAKDTPLSPLKNRLEIFGANGSEQETIAIDTQIRRWLLEGKQSIAVVSEDRLLARRLRALLERADIHLADSAGWALSTTRVAASIESLLLCIEQDFEKDALLDLLKSGHVFTGYDEDFKKLIYRFEHDIIQHEQITNNLERYRHSILSRQERLAGFWPSSPQNLINTLQELESSTSTLTRLCSDKPVLVETYLVELDSCMIALGIKDSLGKDAAGQLIIALFDEMLIAAQQQGMKAGWSQFRAWLGRNLESRYFQPENTHSPVQLLNLSQTGFQRFDALIIAGMEGDKFPGSPPLLQFFNNTVRQHLQLPDTELFHQTRLSQFINLLHSADNILVTYRDQQEGETVIPSPWLSAIQAFHNLAYQDRLVAVELKTILEKQSTDVIRCDTFELPGTQQSPAPSVNEELLPVVYSASIYQQLMDCPYQFFAAQCLGLQAPEEIQQALSKREYGERIHLCLQAFHSNVPNLPGPFDAVVQPDNREEAITLMQEIASTVFDDDMNENFIHRGWYHQWLGVIPVYIDWQLKNKQQAKVFRTERKLDCPVSENLSLRGRIDRIDQDKDQYQVIDYKTGSLPAIKEIKQGEKVQLPFYALLPDDSNGIPAIQSAGYLELGKQNNFRALFPFEEGELEELSRQTLERLLAMNKQLHNKQPLPAWENEDACKHCNMMTLCRRGSWQE